VLLPILGSGFGPEKLQLTARLFYLLLPVVVFGGVAALWSSILNAGDRFALAAVSQGLVPLMSAIALLVGGRFGIYALLCGVVGGFALRLALLGAGLTHEGIRLRPCWPEKDPAIRHVIDQYLPMLAGSALLSSTVLVDQAVAATLPPGSVATLAYGTKVVALMTGLGSAALGTAVLPFFARMVAGADWNELRHTLKTFGTLIAVSATLAALVLFVFSDPIVELVFRRGAFTAADALQVATVQAVYALQLPFFGLGIICARLLSSLGGNRMLMWQALICVPINAALDVVLSRAFGAAGIALATSLVYTISLGTLAVMARHVLRRVESQHAASRQ
jgi:putative peptidoglycan lipid II flippase